MMKQYLITSDRLDLDPCVAYVSSDECGGIATFIGTVRNNTKSRSVEELEFECYEPMAIKEMDKIGKQVEQKFGAKAVSIHHRVGKVPIGEEAVIIAASAPHRDAAFAACRYAIDTLKETVPIWKKERFEDGEVWVSAHP